MAVEELIRPFADLDLDAFDLLEGAERDDLVAAVDCEIRRLAGVRARLIHRVSTCRSFEADGHRTVRAWVEAVLNTTPETAGELVRTSAVLQVVPDLAEAHDAGRVGWDQLTLIAGLWSNLTCRKTLADDGGVLVEPASRLVYDDFAIVVKRWRAHADPDGTHRDHESSRRRRHVRTGVSDHVGIIHAEGDAASVDEMADILRAHVESEFLQDCEQRRLTYGDDAAEHPLLRTHGQRNFDALQQIFRKAAGIATPGVSEPTVNIFTNESTFAAAVRDYFSMKTDHGMSPESFGEQWLCENEQGSPVDPADMVVAALSARVRSVIVTDDGRFLHAGSRARLFTGRVREMILMLGRHRCSRHGCDLSGPCIQVDHVESYACGGCTTASNGGLLCPIHNRSKFDLRFTVTHDQYGWHHFRPDGTEIAPRDAASTRWCGQSA